MDVKNPESLNIISTYHPSYTGGSKNTSRLIHFTAERGHVVEGCFVGIPQYFEYTKSKVVCINSNTKIGSEFIHNNVMSNYSLVSHIYRMAVKKKNPILFGANLFPYCNILLEVKAQLIHNVGITPKLILHPVGTDVSHIGPQIKERVSWLLDNPLVDEVITYSNSFIEEINEFYEIKRRIIELPPILEMDRFQPIKDAQIEERRALLGISIDSFVIHHHSSMRRVKSPESIIEIASNLAKLTNRKCILIMVGPIPMSQVKKMNLELNELNNIDEFKFYSKIDKLLIYWTGIRIDISFLLQISDVELNSSIHDSFNLSLMEAMACGIPVVTSDSVGIKDHVTRSNGGFSFKAKKLGFQKLASELASDDSKVRFFNINEAIEALLLIERNPSLGKSMGIAGSNYVREKFSPKRIITQFEEILG